MKLKSYVNRKRLAIELVLFDIIAIQLAAFLAILTRFEFRIHTIEPLFIDTLVHYAVLISSVFQFIGIHMLAWPIPRSFIVYWMAWNCCCDIQSGRHATAREYMWKNRISILGCLMEFDNLQQW